MGAFPAGLIRAFMMEGSVMEVVKLQAGDGIQPGPD